MANHAFTWVMCASQPLGRDTLLCAIRIDSDRDTFRLASEITDSSLLALCNNLLVLDSQLHVWRFSHLSVTEYFEKHHRSLGRAHGHAATVCLKLLIEVYEKSPDYKWHAYDSDIREPLLFTYRGMKVLCEYVDRYWVTHITIHEAQETNEAEETEEASNLLSGLLKPFLGSPKESSQHYRCWFRRVDRWYLPTPYRAIEPSDLHPVHTPLFAMCSFPLHTLLREWWDKAEFDPMQENDRGHNLLTLAAQAGCKSICEVLVKRGSAVNFLASNSKAASNGSALAAAAKRGHLEVVQYLVASGADVNLLLHAGNRGSALAAAVRYGNLKIASFLIEKGADVNLLLQTGDYGSALAAAVRYKDLKIASFLIEKGADVNLLLQIGLYGSALATAVRYGNVEMVLFLIGKGAGVNLLLQTGLDGSALAAAIRYGNLELVSFLIEKGADVNLLLQTGLYGSALAVAAESGSLETVELLVEKGADVNLLLQIGRYGSALAAAAQSGSLETVELLVEKGADVNLPLRTGFFGTALIASTAAHGKSGVAILSRLLAAGANPNQRVTTGKYGGPLAAAVSRGRYDCVKLLVTAGAKDCKVDLWERVEIPQTSTTHAVEKRIFIEDYWSDDDSQEEDDSQK